MNILFYTILFLIGILVGVFWSIKVREIPKRLDMIRTNSNSKYNEERISKLKYIVIGGFSSIILANFFKIDLQEFDISKLIIYIFSMLYISTLILIGGIDKNYSKIEKSVISFGIISSIMYMLYLCIIDLASIYLNGIYLIIYMALLIIDTFLLRKFAKDSYIINTLLLLCIILVFTDLKTLVYTIIMVIIGIVMYLLLLKSQQKKNANRKIEINQVPVGYFIAASNVIVLFMIRILENYYI